MATKLRAPRALPERPADATGTATPSIPDGKAESRYVATKPEVARRLRAVMSAVFGLEESRIAETDSPDTVAEWDSVGHLQLMLALEEEFGVRFEAGELASLTSVGLIEARISTADGGL